MFTMQKMTLHIPHDIVEYSTKFERKCHLTMEYAQQYYRIALEYLCAL